MPCCIDRMRFSPRISIRRKEVLLLFFISFFFEEYGTCLQLELSDLAIFVGRTYYATTYPPTAAVAFTGGSSAVEQRTVKCASVAILWSGVQISLSGFFGTFWNSMRRCTSRCRAHVLRSYHGESTASHPNCEVKHRWA